MCSDALDRCVPASRLCAESESGLHPERTLVPIDFSDLSLAALDQAIEIAGGAGTHVVHAITLRGQSRFSCRRSACSHFSTRLHFPGLAGGGASDRVAMN